MLLTMLKVILLLLIVVNKTNSFIRSSSSWTAVRSFAASSKSSLLGRKIEDEEAALSNKNNELKNKKSKSKKIDRNTEIQSTPKQEISPASPAQLEENTEPLESESNIELITQIKELKRNENRVPIDNPLRQTRFPPEVVFFGDPRQPPPAEAAQDAKFHGSLLFWARHAYAAPQTSTDRKVSVFPYGSLYPEGAVYRLAESSLSYSKIVSSFESVMGDLEKAKSFINANADIISSTLFLRALTAKKLRAQFENNIAEMNRIKGVRDRYLLAHDQLFFPLNIEIRKAETRVMTYISRVEFREFAQSWDDVEVSLHFLTMLSARLTWDVKVRDLLTKIKKKVAETVDYMVEGVQKDLMTREFRRPGLTSEVYKNATVELASQFPEVYSKVLPEIQLIYETYNIPDRADIQR